MTMIKKICLHTKTRVSAMIYGVILTLASCGEVYDLNGFDWEPELPLSDSVFNREIQVLDLGVENIPQGHRPVDATDPLFFSLEKFSSIHIAYRGTERWDIALHGLYRSSISSNNGKIQGFGYGTSSIGGIIVLDSAYSEVTTVPDDHQFIVPGNVGLGGFAEDFIPGGHVFYTFFGNPFREDKIEGPEYNRYAHMMYCLSEDFAKAFPGVYGSRKEKIKPVTIIVRTASGNYAKMETQSMYKGVMNPLDMYRSSTRPIPYLSFRYMVIKKEEKKVWFRRQKATIKSGFDE